MATLTKQQVDELKKRGLTDQKIAELAQKKGYKLPGPGFFEGVYQTVTKRGENVMQDAATSARRFQDAGTGGLATFVEKPAILGQAVGNLGKEVTLAAGDIGFEGLKTVGRATGLDEPVSQAVQSGLSTALKDPVIARGVKVATDWYTSLDPDSQTAVDQLFAVASLSGTNRAATAVTKTGTRAGQALRDVDVNVRVGGDEAVSKLQEGYKKVFQTTKPLRERYAFALDKGTDPARILAERKLTPTVENGKVRTNEIVDTLEEEVFEKSATLDEALSLYPNTIALEDVRSSVKRSIGQDPTLRREGRVAEMQEQADRILNAYVAQEGIDRFTLSDLQEFKKGQWELSKRFKETDLGRADAHYEVGSALRRTIEQNAEDVAVKGLNRELGQLQDTIKILERADGVAVKGGRLGTRVGQLLGSIAGTQTNLPLIGPILGALGGGWLASQLQKNAVIGPINRALLKYSEVKPDDKVLKETKKFIEDVRAGKKTLPNDEVLEFLGQISVENKVPLLPPAIESLYRSQIGSGPTINLPARTQTTQDALDVAATAGDRARREVDAARTNPRRLLNPSGGNPIQMPGQ
ncbi:hypothetical protein C4568_03810 [Candidatus Parcubacteria bacterium]|nr:MAG: hypothetical protein C4568_03810 [Candidatus Parcubacteria bacterium]